MDRDRASSCLAVAGKAPLYAHGHERQEVAVSTNYEGTAPLARAVV
jgi:hypothetical protein